MTTQFDSSSGRLYGSLAMWAPTLILLAESIALAQAQPAAPSKSDSGAKVEDYSKLPVSQKLANAESMLTAQRRSVSEVSQLVAEVRQQRDMVRLNCLDQKRQIMLGLLRVSEKASQKLQSVVAEGGDSNAPYARIVLASQRSQDMKKQALSCVGAKSVYYGITNVEFVITGDEGRPDPTLITPPPGPGATPPPAASTF
jgi:hypothetical protein